MGKLRCVGLNGYSADRTPEGMIDTPLFTTALAEAWSVPHTLIGEAEDTRDVGWDAALEHAGTTLARARNLVAETLADGDRLALITPRCATSLATLPAVMRHVPDAVVLYFDAHGDLNTPETSSSSYLGGMPVAAALGEWDSGYGAGLPAGQLVHIGGRDLGDAERSLIERRGILAIDRETLRRDFGALKNKLSDRPVFLHIDTDVFDPSFVTAEYAVPDGLTPDDVATVCALVAEHGRAIGIEITEMSPRNDDERLRSHSAVLEAVAPLRAALV
ncbi:MAG: arginase family protein [Pseudomonadota bacterium]